MSFIFQTLEERERGARYFNDNLGVGPIGLLAVVPTISMHRTGFDDFAYFADDVQHSSISDFKLIGPNNSLTFLVSLRTNSAQV